MNNLNNLNNLLVVISGPSGSGKSTIIKNLLERRNNAEQISTYTTREPRVGESREKQYKFISDREYLELLKSNKLMACSKIENDYYGMPVLEDKLNENNNKDLLIDMGVSGGLEIKEKFPETVMIYVIPETEEQLLRQRGARGKTRQSRGLKQIERIMESKSYDWLVINGDLEETIGNIENILDFMRKKKFGDIGEEERKIYREKLGKLVFLNEKNIKFLNDFYNRDKEERTNE